MKVYRVVQWSTGGVGREGVRVLSSRPDVESTGVWVHAPEKADRDAGEVCGIDPIGVTTTSDADQTIALQPDCVVYTAHGETRPEE